jgi:DNA-binding MarR family transcriptional regulator
MASNGNLIDKVAGMTPDELAVLKKVKELGAASADELAIKMRRAGDDLTPEIDSLVKRDLLQVRTLVHDGEETKIYLAQHDVRSWL